MMRTLLKTEGSAEKRGYCARPRSADFLRISRQVQARILETEASIQRAVDHRRDALYTHGSDLAREVEVIYAVRDSFRNFMADRKHPAPLELSPFFARADTPPKRLAWFFGPEYERATKEEPSTLFFSNGPMEPGRPGWLRALGAMLEPSHEALKEIITLHDIEISCDRQMRISLSVDTLPIGMRLQHIIRRFLQRGTFAIDPIEAPPIAEFREEMRWVGLLAPRWIGAHERVAKAGRTPPRSTIIPTATGIILGEVSTRAATGMKDGVYIKTELFRRARRQFHAASVEAAPDARLAMLRTYLPYDILLPHQVPFARDVASWAGRHVSALMDAPLPDLKAAQAAAEEDLAQTIIRWSEEGRPLDEVFRPVANAVL